ncbi:unnamed protein product [Parascedosporium putredinis]|uniref:Acetoin reductase family protein n=1 Tax=Parascedosporium putredinis TaxID=1442378 RepID=A0A9P1H374_9PEZI|nr:unnamed protein product [Parascedosporium putredinis]CAI7996717.1 unnamed protein product [Parascedosporium putredinis]
MPVAIVTGSSQGIGRAIALRLADDGNDIVINDMESQRENLNTLATEIEQKKRRALIVVGDVSREQDVDHLLEQTISTFGELNIMIANAGIIVMKDLQSITVEEFDRVQAVNVRGVFLCYQKAAKQMIKQGKGGRIVGACSISGYRPEPSALAYGVSKWAVRGLTQASAIELGPHGINVNAYCPGMVKTSMWDQIDESITDKYGVPRGTAWQRGVQERPAMKKPSTPEDIAGCVSFLVGKDSHLITGQSVIIDGGIHFS